MSRGSDNPAHRVLWQNVSWAAIMNLPTCIFISWEFIFTLFPPWTPQDADIPSLLLQNWSLAELHRVISGQRSAFFSFFFFFFTFTWRGQHNLKLFWIFTPLCPVTYYKKISLQVKQKYKFKHIPGCYSGQDRAHYCQANSCPSVASPAGSRWPWWVEKTSYVLWQRNATDVGLFFMVSAFR